MHCVLVLNLAQFFYLKLVLLCKIVMGALSVNINWKKVHVFYVFNL